MANTEFVTVVKDGITKRVDKRLLANYISAGWVVVDNATSTTPIGFTKYNK